MSIYFTLNLWKVLVSFSININKNKKVMEEKTNKVIEVLEYPDLWLLRLSGSGVDQLAQIKVGAFRSLVY